MPLLKVITLILEAFIFEIYISVINSMCKLSTDSFPRRMRLSANLESSLLNKCVSRGILSQKFIGKIVFLCWVKAVGMSFPVCEFLHYADWRTLHKELCEEIISPFSSVTFWFNSVHFIELRETMISLRISLVASKIKLSYNYTYFY